MSPDDKIQVMAIVSNQEGTPIEFAALGNQELFTDRSGIAHGEVETTEAGWIPVSAGGYATLNAYPITEINGISMLWVTLSPIDTGVLYNPEDGSTLIHGEGAEFELSASLEPGLFDHAQVPITLTEIPLKTLDAHYQPLSTGEALHLQRVFNIEAISDEVKESTELTAVITAKYFLVLVPTLERYDTEAEAGKDNYFAMELGSLSTAAIDNINFSPTKPQGWTVEFKPEKIDLLEALNSQIVDINIKPPPDTIAGDYYISVSASGQQITSDEVRIRVTVKTSPTWQWVGVGIIVIVVVGVIVIFMRFSRR